MKLKISYVTHPFIFGIKNNNWGATHISIIKIKVFVTKIWQKLKWSDNRYNYKTGMHFDIWEFICLNQSHACNISYQKKNFPCNIIWTFLSLATFQCPLYDEIRVFVFANQFFILFLFSVGPFFTRKFTVPQ